MALSIRNATHANVNANTISIASPSTTVGDLLIAALATGTTSDTVTATQSGWTSIGTNSSSGNSGAAITLFYRFVSGSDPTNWGFSFSNTDLHNGGIIAIPGADPTTPIDQSSIINNTTSTVTQTTATKTPDIVGTLPLAFFGVQSISGTVASYSETLGSTTGVGMSVVYAENAASGNTAYHGSICLSGPLTTDTTNAVSATITWGQYTTAYGFAALLLVKPAVPGAIVLSPSSISVSAPGQTQTVTISQSNSNGVITLTNNSPAVFSLSASTVNGPSATVTVTGVAAGTGTFTATGP